MTLSNTKRVRILALLEVADELHHDCCKYKVGNTRIRTYRYF